MNTPSAEGLPNPKECPFACGDGTAIVEHDGFGGWSVRCRTCGCSTTEAPTDELAVSFWNNRRTASPAEGRMGECGHDATLRVLREMADKVHDRFFWRMSPDDEGNHQVSHESVLAVVELRDEIEQATPAYENLPSPADSPATLDLIPGAAAWKAKPLTTRLRIHAEGCAMAADENKDVSLSVHEIRAMHDDLHEAIRTLAKKPEGRAVDFVAENHHDYWVIQVLCADRPRYYSIRKSDAQLLELPHKDSPFVPVNWRDAITTPPEVGGGRGK